MTKFALTLTCVRSGLLTALLLAPGAFALAQAPAATPPQPAAEVPPTWAFRFAAATYVLPDEDNYVQPTVSADRGAWHLESRYNYEARNSVSAFVGWNLSFTKGVTLDLTPMFGVVAGDLDGVIPALEFTLTYGRLEFYSEGEYVIDLNDTDDRFLYNWSELSVWPTGWLRAGMVIQRTRVFQEERDIQLGILAGVTVGPIEGTAYFFNPGSDDHYFVASVGVSF